MYEYRKGIKEQAFELLGNSCAICGKTDSRVLQFDHIANDGYLERQENKGPNCYERSRQVLNNPERFQLLCADCHAIKTYEFEQRKILAAHAAAQQELEVLQAATSISI